MTTYWHMQMHPDDPSFSKDNIYNILENKKIIGLGDWAGGKEVIDDFVNELKVNDIVAIKTGAKLVALVQVIGGSYRVDNDQSEMCWIVHRRPVRILDWELWGKTLPQPRGTLTKCVDTNAKTTKVIEEWHKRVDIILKQRGVPSSV